jgi:hypothetical protein
MTQEQFQREFDYQISMSIADSMKNEGIINDKDYKIFNEFFLKEYNPPIGANMA